MENRRSPDTIERFSIEGYWTADVTPEQVEAAVNWAKKELEIKDLPYLSQCRLGNTLYYFDAFDSAKDVYEVAMKLQEDNWDAASRLALTLHELDEIQDAIAILGPAIERLEKKDPEDQWLKDDLR